MVLDGAKVDQGFSINKEEKDKFTKSNSLTIPAIRPKYLSSLDPIKRNLLVNFERIQSIENKKHDNSNSKVPSKTNYSLCQNSLSIHPMLYLKHLFISHIATIKVYDKF